MAICVIALFGEAPCQCFSPGANQTTSPGRISSTGPPQRCAPAASRHDQSLTKWMGVPVGTSARLEGDTGTSHPRGFGWLEQRINAHRTRKVLRRAFARSLLAVSFDLHVLNSSSFRIVGSVSFAQSRFCSTPLAKRCTISTFKKIRYRTVSGCSCGR